MASLTLSGSTLVVSGLSSGTRYAFRVYYTTPSGSTGDWRHPTSGTVTATSSSCNLPIQMNMTTAGTYEFYVNVWNGTNNTNSTTNTVTKVVSGGGTTSRTHYARCGDGISYFYIGGNEIKSTGATSFTASTNTLTISNIGRTSGYSTPYLAYYNVSSSPNQWDVSYVSFSGSSYSIDASFSRRITLKATYQQTYYKYTQNVYVDGDFVNTATNSVNTSTSVRVSTLPAYTNYISEYTFNYATANNKTYSASDYIPLSSNSTTIINLYFKMKSTNTYPYRQLIFVDGSQVTSTDNTVNTNSSVQVSSLSGYINNKNKYIFQYATANGNNYAPSGYISLTQGSMTNIYLYFKSSGSGLSKYPYRQLIFVDGSQVTSTDNTVNTNSSVQISKLAGYVNYINNGYKFQKAVVNYVQYSANATIQLTENEMTQIYLYFKSQTGIFPYTQYVYLDGSLLTTTQNTTNTEYQVEIASLAGYTNYKTKYNFQYVEADGKRYTQVEGSIKPTIQLTKDKMTYISFYYTNDITSPSVTPTLTLKSVASNSASFSWSANGATKGTWTVTYSKTVGVPKRFGITPSEPTFTLSGLESNTTYRVYISHKGGDGTRKDSDTVTFTTNSGSTGISYFSWTSNDAANIKAGNSFSSFITATGWNNLTAKINECRMAKGDSAISFTQANKGNILTAEMYNTVKGYISSLMTAGTVAADVNKGDKCLATLFANSDGALKEALNRAIAALNS